MLTDLNRDVNDAEMGSFYASCIRLFRTFDGINSLNQRLQPLFGANYRFLNIPETPQRPGAFYCGSGGQYVCLLDGARTNEQVNGIISGYTSGQGFAGNNGLNAWFVEAARQVTDQIRGDWAVNRPSRITLVGWSAGGAVGTWIAKRILNDLDFPPRIITFGAPRAMARSDAEPLFQLQSMRWMNDTDPIPLLPPRAEDAPILFLSLRLIDAIRFGTYVHLQGGCSVDANSDATPSTLPQQAAMDVVASLAAWYNGQINDPNNTHQLTHYEGRLDSLARKLNPVQPDAPVERAAEQVEQVRRREITAAERRTAALISHRGAEQNATAVEINRTVLFKAVRFGRNYAVVFGDQLFVWSGNKKRARHLARAGNDFLRSLPKQAIVDPETLINQLTAFLNAAVLPGGPVSPPISIGI